MRRRIHGSRPLATWPKMRMSICARTRWLRSPSPPWRVLLPVIYCREAPEAFAHRERMYGKFRQCEAQVFQSPAVARLRCDDSRIGDVPMLGDLSDGLGRAAL